MEYESYASFSYRGYNRDITVSLEDEDADYLPRMIATFADYLRCAGFVYVGVKPIEGGWLIHKSYDKNDDEESWSNPSFSEFFSLSDEEIVQDVVNKAAEEYWEKTVDKAVSDELTPGDTVFYHGKGTPETNLNRKEEPQGHGGHNGVPLNNMRGTVIKYIDSVTGPRVLVKWDNWNDGHNGMGDDPEAKMGATNYWWSNVNNVSKVN